MEGKEIEEVEQLKELRTGRRCKAGDGETMVRRTFTSNDTKDYRNCQYLKWVLVFRDWAQSAKGCGVETR